MNYFAKQMILGSVSVLPLDKIRFDKLKNARSILMSATALEEKYDLLTSNYLEFEQELLTKITEQLIFQQDSYSDFYDLRSILNRRVVNLLTSTKLYYDQIEKHVRTCLDNEVNLGKEAKKFFSEEYDANVEYRFMEALRNYTQHNGLAIHSLSLPSRWQGEHEGRELINKIQLFSTKEDLMNDGKFKKSVLNEIPEKIELIKSIRVYVGSFSNVHLKIRKLIDSSVTQARMEVEKLIYEYKGVNSGNNIGLYAYSVGSDNPSDPIIEKFSIMLNWDDVRVKLQHKNRSLVNLRKWCVTSSCL